MICSGHKSRPNKSGDKQMEMTTELTDLSPIRCCWIQGSMERGHLIRKIKRRIFFFTVWERGKRVRNDQKSAYVICEWSLINDLFIVKSS